MKKENKEKLGKFLKDMSNKYMILFLVSILFYFILSLFIDDLVVRFVFYFVLYYLSSCLYDYIINKLFREDCK